MDKKKIRQFLESVKELMDAEGDWRSKRDAIWQEATADERIALHEVAAWFDP